MFDRALELVNTKDIPAERAQANPLGRHLEGCRIGFDLGGSDRKTAAVVDGQVVFSEETVWDPYFHPDPQYHYDGIMDSLRQAAAHLPRVDAIGGSAAGVYVNNRVKVASLFRGVPPDLFEKRVKNLFLEIKQAWNNVPLEVVNDGEVTALAGSMALEKNGVLGIALGTSTAGDGSTARATSLRGSMNWRLCRWITIRTPHAMNGPATTAWARSISPSRRWVGCSRRRALTRPRTCRCRKS